MRTEDIMIKHLNSNEQWILPLPVIENGETKLRVYMRREKDLLGTFSSVYTYRVGMEDLMNFFSYRSNGQAYNELIKYKKRRISFFKEESKETGVFMLSDIKKAIIDGRSELVCEAITLYMMANNRQFVVSALSNEEKAERQAQMQEADELLANLGYDY